LSVRYRGLIFPNDWWCLRQSYLGADRALCTRACHDRLSPGPAGACGAAGAAPTGACGGAGAAAWSCAAHRCCCLRWIRPCTELATATVAAVFKMPIVISFSG